MNKRRARQAEFLRLAFLLLGAFLPALAAAEIPGLTVLEHAGVTLGVKLDAGGRAVYLGLSAAAGNAAGALPPNALHSPRELWTETPPAADALTASHWSTFKAFQGHVVWVGPQKNFWTRQDLVKDKRDRADDWPPDPYLIYGRAEVRERTPSSLVLDLPESLVSGVRLRKEYRIADDGKITVRTVATNTLGRPNALNLWSNTRVPSDRHAFLKISNAFMSYNAGTWEPYAFRILPWETRDGWFYFHPGRPADFPPDIKESSGKIGVNPAAGHIAVFGPGLVFIKRFATVGADRLAPGQGAVEVFSCISRDVSRGMAELEFYNAYRTLAPGETSEITETWEIHPYTGPATVDGYMEWLKQHP